MFREAYEREIDAFGEFVGAFGAKAEGVRKSDMDERYVRRIDWPCADVMVQPVDFCSSSTLAGNLLVLLYQARW